MQELVADLGSLTPLINEEKDKCTGILNGIDDKVWDPLNDPLLDHHLKKEDWDTFKKKNKGSLCKKVKLGKNRMLLSFIGRFAFEKGADLLAPAIEQYLKRERDINFMILGSGDTRIEKDVIALAKKYPKNVACSIAYDEKLAREIYAGSDFLIMPSRFEPCGLNQMFCMRYGTVPVVRSIGGLKDTVPDIEEGGNGIAFADASSIDILLALTRASKLYVDKKKFVNLRNKIVKLDFTWSKSAQTYSSLYKKYIKK